MTTKQYVIKFGLNSLESEKFDRDGFLKDFEKEFLDRVETTRIARENMKLEFTFHIFQHIIKEMQDKFWAISNKKVGKPFTMDLFSAFYAMSVIPIREKMFPEIHRIISQKREAIIKGEREPKKWTK